MIDMLVGPQALSPNAKPILSSTSMKKLVAKPDISVISDQTSKAAAISYCESLRGELRGTGVKVVTIAPGYIDTPLTQKNRYPMPFLMTAKAFALLAYSAIGTGTSYRVIPWQMGWVATLLRLLPKTVLDRVMASQPRKHRGN